MTLWIVAADAAKARILETDALNKPPRIVHTAIHPLSRAKGMDIVADRPGYTRRQSRMEAKGPATDPKEVEAEDFARELAEYLQKQLDVNRYDALAILSPPHFLGLIRAALSSEVERIVVFEQSKDLNFIADSQLPAALAEAVEASFRESFRKRARSEPGAPTP